MKNNPDPYFSYPPNLQEVDLATLVSMYRDRGVPKESKTGDYFCCALTKKMIKKGKWWFGYYYSQKAWDILLTSHCEGYPLTKVELNVLGLAIIAKKEPPERDYVEQHSKISPRLAFMIVNDLNRFGFISIKNQHQLMITPRGEKALQGISQRIYGKKFSEDMLAVNQDEMADLTIERAPRKGSEQANLF